jgi:acetylornithine deacetylase
MPAAPEASQAATSALWPTTPKDILAQLVAFDTTSHKTNLPMANWIRDYLASHGIEATLLPAPNGIHTNLFATIGPKTPGGIGLSGHMDVVPVTGQPWDTDPFTLTEKGSRLYARGSADMKGYLACMLAAVPDFKRRNLKQPIHLIFSYDEEVGCTGVIPMTEAFGKTLPKPEIIFVGEPSMMGVVDGHKGGARFRTTIIGKDAHSSMPSLGVGSIFIASDLIQELKRLEAQFQKSHPAPRFEPPFPTITVSFIEGGIAHNIIPPRCVMDWGIRLTPGLDHMAIPNALQAYAERELLPAMRQTHAGCDITTELLGLLPAFASGENSPAVSLALKLAGTNTVSTVAYGTEASHFQAVGCSTVVIGPGDIAQAHQPNEFIESAELDHCMSLLARVGSWAEAG